MPTLSLLHDWDSLQSLKVRICLAEKGLSWSGREIELTAFAHLSPEFLAINPAGVVPVLIDGPHIISESSVINEYLDDICPQPGLRPAAAHWRAAMRAWAKYQDDVVHPAIRPPTFNLMIKPRVQQMPVDAFEAHISRHPQPPRAAAYRAAVHAAFDEEAVLASIRRFVEILERMQTCLADTRWLAGDDYSLADVAMTSFIDRLERLQMTALWKDRATVAEWVDRIRGRPSWQTASAPEAARLPVPDPGLVAQLLRKAV